MKKSKPLSFSCEADVRTALRNLSDERQARILSKFFKTGPGEYGEGDIFWGIKVPQIRAISRRCRNLPLSELEGLLQDPVHECRLCAALSLVEIYQNGDEQIKKACYQYYLSHLKAINNWDLVDLTAPKIIGDYLHKNPHEKRLLVRLAKSKNLWERRIAVVATHEFIKKGDFADTFAIAKILMKDPHDLIHKAVGWMLREVGKRNRDAEIQFLDEYCTIMPRTALRYAIEHFPEKQRQGYLTCSRVR